MIGEDEIKLMKPTVRLVNTARGGIINEDAVYQALAENRIGGAALDVFPIVAREPVEVRGAGFGGHDTHHGARVAHLQTRLSDAVGQVEGRGPWIEGTQAQPGEDSFVGSRGIRAVLQTP